MWDNHFQRALKYCFVVVVELKSKKCWSAWNQSPESPVLKDSNKNMAMEYQHFLWMYTVCVSLLIYMYIFIYRECIPDPQSQERLCESSIDENRCFCFFACDPFLTIHCLKTASFQNYIKKNITPRHREAAFWCMYLMYLSKSLWVYFYLLAYITFGLMNSPFFNLNVVWTSMCGGFYFQVVT